MTDYKFDCDHDIEGMLPILNAAGPWNWQFRDSDSQGFYLSATNVEGKTKVRITEDRPGYLLELTLYPDDSRTISREALHAVIREKILPAIGARNIRPA